MAEEHKFQMRARLENLEEVKQKLLDLGTMFCESTTQVDHYYKKEGEEKSIQKPGAYIIRVRDEVNKKSLNLKQMESQGKWIEHSTDITNASEMYHMLKIMGYKEIFTVFKDRMYAQLDDLNINIDNIKGIGTFLEIEIKSANSEQAKAKIIEMFRKLGVHDKDIEQKGYTRIIAESKGFIFEGLD